MANNNSMLSVISAGLRKKSSPQGLSSVPGYGGSGGWFGLVRESFAGAFQAGVEVDSPRNILAFSAVFACVTRIASDISKLWIDLVVEDAQGISTGAPLNSPYWGVLRKPNNYQNRIKFIEHWLCSKLLYGNAYILKERDGRGIVVALHVLDSQRVQPLVASNGDVYYQLSADHLAGLQGAPTIPAMNIIHDRMNCLWHPLVGVSPIYACGMAATTGNKIQANSAALFHNMSRPSGMLTAPGEIDDETAARLKLEFESNFGGAKIGRLAVLGNGLTYSAMSMSAADAQLVAQLEWTIQDVARCFHMPLFKIGAGAEKDAGKLSVEAQQQLYLNDCLHVLIEDLEICLDEGLALPTGYHAELNEEGLLRMDQAALYTGLQQAVSGCMMTPNEARRKLGLPPLPGGDSLYLQQQNFSLEALAKRDAKDDPFATISKPTTAPAAPDAPAATSAPVPTDEPNDGAAKLMLALITKFNEAEFHA